MLFSLFMAQQRVLDLYGGCMKIGFRIFDVFNGLFLLILTIVMIYPLIYVVFTSISDYFAIANGSVRLFPSGINMKAYYMILQNDDVLIAYWNSIRYAAVGTLVFIMVTSIVAYPLTVKRFWLNKGAMIYYALTMFFGGGMVPTYLLYKTLGLVNSMWVMVLPSALAVFNIVLFRTYFQSLGEELRDAAYMDGSHDLYVLFRIYLPLSKPMIATLSLFHIVGIWNNFFTPLLYLHDERLQPLTILLRRLLIQLDIQTLQNMMFRDLMERREPTVPIEAFRAASIVVTIIPIVLIYPFIQRYFVKGIMIGALKS